MDELHLSGCTVDLRRQVVIRGDERTPLTTKEVAFLRYLAERPGQSVTQDELLVEVWGHKAAASNQPLYSTVKRLRKKIEPGGGEPLHLFTVHGEGYRLELGHTPTAAGAAIPAPLRARPLGRMDEALGALVGRDALAARVLEAVGRAPLVTLVGPGGVGKTRLALAVARERAAVFADVSAATTMEGLASAVVREMGMDFAPGEDLVQLGRLALDGCGLVILDNVEQVVGPAREWVRGVRELPDAPVLLLTSREPLHAKGEVVIEVPPLALDDAAALLERALVEGGAAVGGPDPSQVRALALALEGIPLAIEIVGAHAREIDWSQGGAGLQGVLLELQRHGGPERHESLAAALDWSWALLSPEERRVFASLGAFSGGVPLDRLEAVAGRDARLAVPALAGRSLVRVHDGRLTLLETVSAYCARRLDDLDPDGAVRDAHARAFLEVARTAMGAIEGPLPQEGVQRARMEHDNLLRAVAWAAPRVEEGGELAWRVAALCQALGLGAEAGAAVERGLAGAPRPADRSRLRVEQARIEGRIGALRWEELAREAELAGDTEGAAIALCERAVALARSGRWADAQPVFARATALAPEPATVHVERAKAAWDIEDFTEAERAASEALVRATEGDLLRVEVRATQVLAEVRRRAGQGAEGLALVERAVRLSERTGDQRSLMAAWGNLGIHRKNHGDRIGAREAYERAHEIAQRSGQVVAREAMATNLAGLDMWDGELETAREALNAALEVFELHRHRPFEVNTLDFLGCADLMVGDLARATTHLYEGLHLAITLGPSMEARLRDKVAYLCLARRDVAGVREQMARLRALDRTPALLSDFEALAVWLESGGPVSLGLPVHHPLQAWCNEGNRVERVSPGSFAEQLPQAVVMVWGSLPDPART